MNETELTIELEQARAENRYLRHQLDNAFFEALRLRHIVERIYAVSHMAIHQSAGDGAGQAGTAGTQPEY